MRRSSAGVVELAPDQPWPAGWTDAGVAEVLAPLVLPARRERLEGVLETRLGSLAVVLDDPHDPHNGAAVVRSADAFGVQAVHVLERKKPFLIATTVSRGSERWVDVRRWRDPGALVGTLRAQGFALAVTHPQGTLDAAALARLPRVALLVGNERRGVGPELAAHADVTVRVPMRGFAESLNLSVTTAILLTELARERPGDLSPEERVRLRARWLALTVDRSLEVLAALPPR